MRLHGVGAIIEIKIIKKYIKNKLKQINSIKKQKINIS